ncbi:MAG: hypothetical protein KG003_13065 [Bacteroidetes bacterium]|nr:hypothetical protein [Bacteroidota bacterium]
MKLHSGNRKFDIFQGFKFLLIAILILVVGAGPIWKTFTIVIGKINIEKSIGKLEKDLPTSKILLNKKEYSKLFPGDEIYFQQKKYDIFQVLDKGDFWEAVAYCDVLETNLEADLLNNKTKDSNHQKTNITYETVLWFIEYMNFEYLYNTKVLKGNSEIAAALLTGFPDKVFQPPV